MSTNTKDPTAALSQLSTDIADIIKGYEVMEERADNDLRPIAQRLHALHETHAADLFIALEDMGGHPEHAGSMMGAVHQAVATGRDWFNALDASALPQIVQGEERLVTSYDGALEASQERSGLHEMLRHQRASIQAQIDALSED